MQQRDTLDSPNTFAHTSTHSSCHCHYANANVKESMAVRLAHKVGWVSYKLKTQSGRIELCSDMQSEGLWQFITHCQSQEQSTAAAEPCFYASVVCCTHPLLAPHCISSIYFSCSRHLSRRVTFTLLRWPCMCCCHGYQVAEGKM